MVYSSYLHIMHIQCCLIDKCKFINSIIKLGGQEVKVCFIDMYKTKTESHQVKGNKDKTILGIKFEFNFLVPYFIL